MAGVFFEDFMHSNRLDRIISAVLFLIGGIACAIYPYDEKKKDEHIFEFEKETPPLTQTTPLIDLSNAKLGAAFFDESGMISRVIVQPTQTTPSGSNTVQNTEEK